MNRFVENANLPVNVEKVLIGEKYKDILEKPLKKAGIEALFVPDNPLVDKRLSSHADLSVFHPGDSELLLAPYLRGSELAALLEREGFFLRFADIVQGQKYPNDSQLNAIMVGNRLIYSEKVSAGEVIQFAAVNREMELISVKQGYVNCSVCAVDRSSIITADSGIAEKCGKSGMDVLLIEPGYFELDGYDCGFIGGCTFKLSSGVLAFTGRIDMHPDKERIINFLYSHAVEVLYLTALPAFDIGGAIPISEKTS